MDGFSKKKPVAVTFTRLQVDEQLFTREGNQRLSISLREDKEDITD